MAWYWTGDKPLSEPMRALFINGYKLYSASVNRGPLQPPTTFFLENIDIYMGLLDILMQIKEWKSFILGSSGPTCYELFIVGLVQDCGTTNALAMELP